MANIENQSKRIYLKSTRQWVEVSDEFYQEYTRKNDALRKRMQYHHCCSCPRNKWWLCDGSCFDCEYQITTNDYISLDYTTSDGEGNEKSLLDNLADPSQNLYSIQEDRELLAALYAKLNELDPEGRRICELVMSGKSERDSAKEMDMARNTYVYKRNKVLGVLYEALKDYR